VRDALNPLSINHDQALRAVEDRVIEKELLKKFDPKTQKEEKAKFKWERAILASKIGDDFLDNYNADEEKVTWLISDFLVEHPTLLEKVRHLQKDNKLLNPYDSMTEEDLSELTVSKSEGM
jgi:hypothetical protein